MVVVNKVKKSSKKKDKSKKRKSVEDSEENSNVGVVEDPPKKKVKLNETKDCNSLDNDAVEKAKGPGDFSHFDISPETIERLKEKGIKELFPIQYKTFDAITEGKDVIAQARTGTGKTLSFSLPLIEKLHKNLSEAGRGRNPQVLVLAPTRELAIQVHKNFDDMSAKSLLTACIYGGTPYERQVTAMQRGLDVVVGTPGRITDHVNKGNLILSSIRHVILDEVDRMLDMGFAPSVEEIFSYIYPEDGSYHPQTMLFSATCPPWVSNTAKRYMDASNTVKVDLIGNDKIRTSETVEHLAIRSNYQNRSNCIGDVVQVYSGRHGRSIIFTDTKRDANELALTESIKIDTQVLHGDIEQKQREITLKAFRSGGLKCLVTTNVAARGLDIPEVDLVIQISPPKDIEDYIHRSGRTGRAGRKGTCVCFYKPQEEQMLQKVERMAGITFKRIAPPQPKDIVTSSCDDAVRSLETVTVEMCEAFEEQAKMVADSHPKGALGALAAALAAMSGATELKHRSILNSCEGCVTWHISTNFEVRGGGFFFGFMEKKFGLEVREKMQGMRITKDKTGALFDLPVEFNDKIKADWKDSDTMKLCIAEEIPELLERDNRGFGNNNRSSWSNNGRGGGGGFNRGYGNRNGGYQGNRGGSRGRGGGGRGQSNGFRGRSNGFSNSFGEKGKKTTFD